MAERDDAMQLLQLVEGFFYSLGPIAALCAHLSCTGRARSKTLDVKQLISFIVCVAEIIILHIGALV